MSRDEIPSFGSDLLDLETRLFGRPVEIMVMNLSYDEMTRDWEHSGSSYRLAIWNPARVWIRCVVNVA